MKITKQQLKQIIREEYQALYEDEDDDEARALELAQSTRGAAGEYTPTADEERAAYEERSSDLPREWPLPPALQDPLSNLPGPKGLADHFYRIKKLIDELPIDSMEKAKYLNKILNDVLSGEGPGDISEGFKLRPSMAKAREGTIQNIWDEIQDLRARVEALEQGGI